MLGRAQYTCVEIVDTTALGLALVVLGIWWQHNESRINTRLAALVPEGLRPR